MAGGHERERVRVALQVGGLEDGRWVDAGVFEKENGCEACHCYFCS